MPDRRFPPPWDIEEANASCFIVKDNNGQWWVQQKGLRLIQRTKWEPTPLWFRLSNGPYPYILRTTPQVRTQSADSTPPAPGLSLMRCQ